MVKPDPLATYHIREATENDIPAICDIYNERILNSTSLLNYEPVSLENRLTWYRDTRGKGFPLIVAVERSTNSTIAYASFGSFRPHTAYRMTVETSIYIHQDHLRRGLGRLLLTELIRLGEEMNIHTIIGGITSENTPSVELYKSFGFQFAAEFKDAGFKFGKFVDVCFYELILDTEPAVVNGEPEYVRFPWGSYTFGQPFIKAK